MDFIPNLKAKAFIEAMNTQYVNGGLTMAKFQITPSIKPQDFPGINNKAFTEGILNNKSLQNSFPELYLSQQQTPISLGKTPVLITGLYELLGKLSNCLALGGAYGKQDIHSHSEIIQMTTDFIENFISNDYLGYHTITLYDSWSPWFLDIAWDYTFIVLHKSLNELSFICITDTD